jgi:hypothetical protein
LEEINKDLGRKTEPRPETKKAEKKETEKKEEKNADK